MAKKIVDVAAATVTFDFSKDGGPVLAVALADIPEKIQTRLALHGISQKGGDSYANAKNQPNPVEWAVQQVTEVIENLKNGIFSVGRTGEGGTRVSLLARALHRIKLANGDTESTERAAQDYVDELEAQPDGKEQIAALKAKKKVARMLDTIRLEDAEEALKRAKAKAEATTDEEDEE